MITLTEKDLLRIQTLLREIRQESMRVDRRKYRIYNLCDKVSVIIRKAEKQNEKDSFRSNQRNDCSQDRRHLRD